MANTTIQLKRSSVADKQPNTSTISIGELAINLTDRKLYSSDGSNIFEPAANVTNLNVTANATISAIVANGSLGTSGQTLTSNGSTIYWNDAGAGTVTSVDSGNGLAGGPVTTSGTLSVLANNGITANSAGVFVTQGTGAVVNATGVHVNSAYIGTLAANSATYLGGNTASDLRSYSDTIAGTAYSNAVSYADTIAGTAYSNATSYADTISGTAYSNATSYADALILDSVTNTSIAYAASANSVKTTYDYAGTIAGTAYSNATSYADTIAGTAYSNATSYADTISGTAYSNAVSTASSDATSKAATAYSNAVSTASSDATSKAGTAYSNATSYAATIAGTAYSNATSYAATIAGTAYTNATSYADTIAGTAYSNATSYAATIAGTAYTNATSYAATIADTAYTNATSYAATIAGTAYSNAVTIANTYSNATNILTKLSTVDGAGSGLDADTVDGIQGAEIWRKGTDIPTAADLNDYTTDGYYHQNANANAAAGTNYPVALAGMLEVTSDGAMVYQRYTAYSSTHIVYVRTKYSGTWYSWATQWSSLNDGTGSGLDADLWDGNEFASYLNQAVLTSSSPTFGTVSATNFDNVSDISLKENIISISSPKDIIDNLNPVSFNWKDTGEKSFGFIAQEVENILPEIVHTKADGAKTVSYIQLIPFLIQIIKEQQQQIDIINNKLNNA